MSFLNADPVEHLMVAGRKLDPGAPALPATMPGILRGEGIFEAFRVDAALETPFLERHAQRLAHSARLMDMDLRGDGLLASWPAFRSGLPPGPWRVRFTVLLGAEGELWRIWCAGRPAKSPPELALVLAGFSRDPRDPLSSAKLTSRAAWQAARRRAREQGAWDALLPTSDGFLSECTSSNVFLWHRGALRTPSEDCGILRGITRRALLEACAGAGIAAVEERIPVAALRDAEEIYVTSAVLGVSPVVRIAGIREGLPGVKGPRLAALRAAWARRLAAVPPASAAGVRPGSNLDS